MQPTDPAAAMRINARGLVFDVRAAGAEDGEPVLLLHGFPQHAGEWAGILPALHGAGLRSYALDQRGYSPGARPGAVEDYAMAECVADVLAVLDALGLDSAHLVGHDWGALVAWHLTAQLPDRVRTLTAISVPHPAAMAYAISTDIDQRNRSAYVGLFRQAGKAERVLLADGAARLRTLFSGLEPDRVELYVAPMLVPGALTAALNWYRAMATTDLMLTTPIAVPTTFVWSDGDIAIGRTAAEACAGHIAADYRFVSLPDVSHWIPDQAPAALGEAVLARIAGTG